MLQDNYEIHANLSSKTADSIIEAADSIIETASDVIESITSTKGEETQEYESDDSYKSENYHPRRIRKYSVRNLYEDVVEENDSPIIKELRDFRRRSADLSKDNINQLSDLRLLSLDCIYLFSEDIDKSVTKYLGTENHYSFVPTFANKKCKDMNPVVFKWCMDLTNFKFEDSNNKWMELQKATISMLSEAIANNDKALVQIANMLHVVAPRLLISSNELNVEDTFVHTVISYIIKLIFGIEDLLMHQWANVRLNQINEEEAGKFTPDYIAYVKTRSTRHDVAIAEVKPTGSHSGKPPSDLVKLGQQMKVMLNNLIGHKVTDPVVCGILVEGKQCSLFKMDIIAPRFYKMILLTTFPLCTSSSELCLIPNTFIWMSNLKDIAVDTAKQIEINELAKAKGKRKFEEAIPSSWVQNGTCTFAKIKKTGD